MSCIASIKKNHPWISFAVAASTHIDDANKKEECDPWEQAEVLAFELKFKQSQQKAA